METLVCKKCGQEKALSMFTKNKSKKSGYNSWCKSCDSIYKAEYRKQNVEKIRQSKKKCYEAKKEQYNKHNRENYYKHQKERIACSVKWGMENKERRNATFRKHRAENVELFRAREQLYRDTHRENIRRLQRKNQWEKYYRYCTDITKIENYEKALADNFENWERHHRLETHNSDGEKRLVNLSREELIALDMYYDRPPEELIWLKNSEHAKLHWVK